jgi:phosphonate transport system substrate-binding protein
MDPHHRHTVWFTLCLCLVAALAGCAAPKPTFGSPDEPILMSLVPLTDTEPMTQAGHELEGMLKTRTGLTYKVDLSTSFGASAEAMGARQFQIAWLDADSYLAARQKDVAVPGLVVMRDASLYHHLQIIVNNEAGIRTLADLEGKKFCFVSVTSPTDYLIPRAMLRAAGVDPDKSLGGSQNAGTPDSVVIAVYEGGCDAGATYVDARLHLQRDYPDILEKTSVLGLSPDIPNEVVTYSKEFSPELRAQTTAALLDIAATSDGKRVLQTLYQVDGFRPEDDAFFNNMRDMIKQGKPISPTPLD